MKDFSENGSSLEAQNLYRESLGTDIYDEFILGKNTTKILLTDPKLLLFTLARYKFVAKMFSGLKRVLEIGCQEGFGAMIVSQTTDHLHGIDFFIPHIQSCKRRISSTKLTFEVADILSEQLTDGYDGVFALDVLEHIHPEKEELFMQNVCNLLKDQFGIAIIGMPSLESQKYASEASKIGHVNCKTGDQLKSLASKYFSNVFLFSMNDEVLHIGFPPMAHYILVMCVNPKNHELNQC